MRVAAGRHIVVRAAAQRTRPIRYRDRAELRRLNAAGARFENVGYGRLLSFDDRDTAPEAAALASGVGRPA
jgi:hypothetical protein